MHAGTGNTAGPLRATSTGLGGAQDSEPAPQDWVLLLGGSMTQQDCKETGTVPGFTATPPITGPAQEMPVPASAYELGTYEFGSGPEGQDSGEIDPALLHLPTIGLAPEGYIHLVLPPGGVVSGSMAAAAAAEINRLAGDRKMPLLLVLVGVQTLTRGARSVFGDARSLEAVAVLGVSPVDRVIANFLLGGSTPPCPTRYFSVQGEALAWLRKKHVA